MKNFTDTEVLGTTFLGLCSVILIKNIINEKQSISLSVNYKGTTIDLDSHPYEQQEEIKETKQECLILRKNQYKEIGYEKKG